MNNPTIKSIVVGANRVLYVDGWPKLGDPIVNIEQGESFGKITYFQGFKLLSDVNRWKIIVGYEAVISITPYVHKNKIDWRGGQTRNNNKAGTWEITAKEVIESTNNNIHYEILPN